ncbi:MAG: hypothetical protein JKY95_06235 [Planctomycetaceae bacterium]|nr:hypothetical protein [Planctomycetaceae bacterium]
MSDSIVIELQQQASDGNCPVDELLRKALIVSTKLQISDFKELIDNELTGYQSTAEVPEYRVICASIKAINPVTGQKMPLHFESAQDEERFSSFPARQSDADIQNLTDGDKSTLHCPLTPQEKQCLMRQMTTPVPFECQRLVSASSLVAILNAVRNIILKWSLRLEEQGILGEGMKFTPEEKEIAMTSQNIHIGSFQGVLGDVNESTVTQALTMSVKAGDLNSLQQKFAEAGISQEDLQELKLALETDPEPKTSSEFGPKVSAWVGSIMTKAVSGSCKLTVDTVAKLIPAAIAAYYDLPS